jgi:hypothetical protein
MNEYEMRKAKAELHKVIIDTVLAFGGTLHDDATMYRYIIELASNELMACVPFSEKN